MELERRALPVDELSVGMYVSALDRPWIETPFLFQGFLIESDDVIDELRNYCKFVYVDIGKGDTPMPAARERAPQDESSTTLRFEATGPRPPPPTRKLETTAESEKDTASTDDTARLKAELVHAREAHASTEKAVADLLKRLHAGKDIDVMSVQKTLDPMIESIVRNDDAMSWLARMKQKDDYIYNHSIASSIWAMIFGKHLGLSKADLQVLGTGAVFVDVGKTKIPNELLIKPESLTPDEQELMRQHVEHGVEIVSRIDGIDPRVIEMVAGHHERHNGTGYPRGLSGAQIPVFARIAGIVDAYDAMTTPRPYARPISTYDAIRQLNNLASVEFAEEVVEQFVQAIGVFPVGTLVELNTGEVGIVIAQNRVRRLRPKVMLLLDSEKAPLPSYRVVDLRNQLADASGENSIWIEQGLAPGDYGIAPSEYYL